MHSVGAIKDVRFLNHCRSAATCLASQVLVAQFDVLICVWWRGFFDLFLFCFLFVEIGFVEFFDVLFSYVLLPSFPWFYLLPQTV